LSEIQTTDWDETAANNNQTAPNGWPEGMPPSGVNDAARESMAAIKRWFNRVTGRTDAGALVASAGTSTAITVAYDTAPASLYTGLEVSFKVTTTCGAAPTLNVNSLGAKNIQKVVGSGYVNLAAGDIVATQHVKVKYDGTLDKWILLTVPNRGIAFSAHKNGTDQTGLVSTVATKVTFGTEDFDVGSCFASSTFTPTIAGKYLLTASVRWTNANAVDNEQMTLSIYKNGAAHRVQIWPRPGTSFMQTSISAVVDANGSSDTFEVYATKGGAGNGDVQGSTEITYFQGMLIT